MNRIIPLQTIDEVNFKEFGYVLRKPAYKPNIDNDYERYWHDSFKLDKFSNEPIVCFYETKRTLPICPSLESIKYNEEAYVNLGKSHMVLFVAPYDESGICNEDKIEAFLVTPGTSVSIYKNIWHFQPIPIDADNLFLVILGRKNVYLENTGYVQVDPEEIVVHELENCVTVDTAPILKEHDRAEAD